MSIEVVPESEMDDFISAIEDGRCCVCYGPISNECGGDHTGYCHEHDDGCEGLRKVNCPLMTGMRPCECDLPRCPLCGYTEHDARFEGDHNLCEGVIPT